MATSVLSLKAALAALACAALLLQSCESARILAVMPIPARSHHIVFGGVTKALAERGHEVTYVTGLEPGNKLNPTNNRLVHIGNPYEAMFKETVAGFWKQAKSPIDTVFFLMNLGVNMVNATMRNPLMQAEINKPGQKYDLIIVEAFFFQESFVGLGHQFDCPVVAINSLGSTQFINDVMGNPDNPAWVPSSFLGFSDRMSFSERAINALSNVANSVLFNWYYFPKQQEVLQTIWPDAPPLQELLRTRLALTLLNTHFTLGYATPLAPNTIEIGGLHINEKSKSLPKELQQFMDAAKEGVVYFSMGSSLKMEHLQPEKAQALLGALGALKERVLLKWDGPKPQGLAPNIRHIDWAPQADVLAHPNTRLFITHGGLLSTQESVYYGVPMVGIPLFGDQHFNMLLAVQKGFCVRVDFRTLSKESMSAALEEVLRNPKYKASASQLSRLFRSKAMRPVDAAVFAVEHVMQHGGDHMRPSCVGMPLHQLLLLDVLLVVLLAALLPTLGLVLGCRALGRRLCGGSAADAAKARGAGKKKNKDD